MTPRRAGAVLTSKGNLYNRKNRHSHSPSFLKERHYHETRDERKGAAESREGEIESDGDARGKESSSHEEEGVITIPCAQLLVS